MKEINISRTLANRRKEKGITQDELARYIGVSKASVSKWETGQSYPDITFLPLLAAYFNISIDELMGYEPQMTKEDIRALYHKLAADFVSEPFEQVHEAIREAVKKYYACFPLLFQMGALLVNHSMLAGTPEKSNDIVLEAKALFTRVKTESDDVELAKEALNMEAMCFLMAGQPEEVLTLLENTDAPVIMTEPLLASAYYMVGKSAEAITVLQRGTYQLMLLMMDQLSQYLSLSADDASRFAEIYRRGAAICDTFDLRQLHPSVALRFYITAAYGFASQGDPEKAMDALEIYTDITTGKIFPLTLQSDGFFDKLGDWLQAFEMPRNEETIRQSILEAVTGYPGFSDFAKTERFIRMRNRLKNALRTER